MKVKQLSGQDASFLYLESDGAHLHLTALYVYQQPENTEQALVFGDIVKHVKSRLDSWGIFRQILFRPPLDLDHPYWVDDQDFDIQRHIRRAKTPRLNSMQDLYEVFADLHAQPLDLSHPPWEMHVIEELDSVDELPQNCFAIIAKYHHAAVDGASGSQMVNGLHDNQPVKITPGNTKPWVAQPGPAAIDVIARSLLHNTRTSYQLAKTVFDAAPAMAKGVLNLFTSREQKTAAVPKTRFNQPVGPDRVFHCWSMDMSDIRLIRDAEPGPTANDVILTICGGALRSWLKQQRELPTESLVAMVPVNARSTDEQSLAGNKLATLWVPIHTDIENPVDRLRAVWAATSRAKKAANEPAARQTNDIADDLPALPLSALSQVVTKSGLAHHAIRLCNCTITNVPGPKETLYLGPAKMIFTSGSAPILDGMGLLITASSYLDKMTFSFTSCPEMLPDATNLGQLAQEALEQLLIECHNRMQ